MTTIISVNERQILMENVKFMFRPNFAGRKEKYNNEGSRYFNVEIHQDDVPLLEEYGLNIKIWDPRKKNPELDPAEYPVRYYTKVSVYYGFNNPKVILFDLDDLDIDKDDISDIEESRKTYLDEDTVGLLDEMSISNIDISIKRREPHPDGMYARLSLNAAYITVELDPLSKRYGV